MTNVRSLMTAYGITYATAIFIYVQYRKLAKRYEKLHGITTYLVDMLEQNDVPLSEFDLIALSELGVKFNVIHSEEQDA